MPEDFPLTFTDVLTDPKNQFRDFKFEALPLSEDGEMIWYERQTPLKFRGLSNWAPTEPPLAGQPLPKGAKDGLSRYYYIITPSNFHFGTQYYDQNKAFIEQDVGYRLLKYEMLSPMYNGK